MTERAIRCRGCRRLLGHSPVTRPVPIQCTDPGCYSQEPLAPNEERDSIIRALARLGRKPAEIGVLFGITRQRVEKVIDP